MVSIDALLADPRATAFLVVDMQNDFLLLDAPVSVPGGLDLRPLIDGIAQQSRTAGFPVVFTQETHRADHGDFGIELAFEPPHCLAGSGGEDLVAGLLVDERDVIIRNKRRYNAFLGTELDLVLRTRGVQNLIVSGVCTDICVISTVHHARNLDYRCFVLSDGTAGTTAERHQAALLCMSNAFAWVGTAKDLLPSFGLQVPATAAG